MSLKTNCRMYGRGTLPMGVLGTTSRNVFENCPLFPSIWRISEVIFMTFSKVFFFVGIFLTKSWISLKSNFRRCGGGTLPMGGLGDYP